MNEEETIAKMLSELAKARPYVGETQTAFDDRARRRCEAATQVDLVEAVGREAVIKAATGFLPELTRSSKQPPAQGLTELLPSWGA